MLQLPENFETYNQARKNGFLKMKERNHRGYRWTGYQSHSHPGRTGQ